MLINITSNPVVTRYAQREIIVEPGKSLDVRDFRIQNHQVEAVERHITMKNPNCFRIEKTKDIFETNKEYITKIDELNKSLESMQERLIDAEKAKESAETKMRSVMNENEGMKNIVSSLRKENKELLAKVKAAR